jgi:OHCU decarboxylase
MQQAIALHAAVTGEPPRGWYTGRCSMNTVRLAAEAGCFEYVSDSYADDLPYWFEHEGGAQLVIPYTLDSNDMRFATAQGFNSGDQFFTYLRDAFDELYREGRSGRPKMLNIGLHCRLSGRPGRTAALRRFLEYVNSHEKVWIARRIDIARHWQQNHPFQQPVLKPSIMGRDEFVGKFGGVFEHSPWIARHAYDLELGPAHNCATGIHSALARIFRTASEEQRLGVLTAHPDLAGKLAASRQLTPQSAGEQASAGLDALTDAERARFGDMNRTYVERFGFPFIIAVKGMDKASILSEFEKRISNDRRAEFENACRQVEKIALLRLREMFGEEVK